MQDKIILFIDTEFTDFVGSQLISFGAVSLDGEHEFYVELTDYNKKLSSEFVRLNVENQLDLAKYGKTSIQAGAALYAWIEDLEKPVEIWIDYITDWELMLSLLDHDPPKNLISEPTVLFAKLDAEIYVKAAQLQHPNLMWFYQEVRKGLYAGFLEYFFKNPLPKQHHALADAKANRLGWIRAQEVLHRHG